MWRSLGEGSRRDVLNLRLRHCLIPEIAAQKAGGIEVHFAAKQLTELALHGEEFQTRFMPGFEFHQDVEVACRAKIFPQDRPEEGKLANMVSAAKLRDLFRRDWHDAFAHARTHTSSAILTQTNKFCGVLVALRWRAREAKEGLVKSGIQ